MVHCPNFDTRKYSEIFGSIQASCNRVFVFGTLIDFCRRQLHWGSEKRKLHWGSGLRNFYTLICVRAVTTSLGYNPQSCTVQFSTRHWQLFYPGRLSPNERTSWTWNPQTQREWDNSFPRIDRMSLLSLLQRKKKKKWNFNCVHKIREDSGWILVKAFIACAFAGVR